MGVPSPGVLAARRAPDRLRRRQRPVWRQALVGDRGNTARDQRR